MAGPAGPVAELQLKAPSPESLKTGAAAAGAGGEPRSNVPMLLPREARPGRDRWALGRVSSAAALAAKEAAPALD